MKGYIFTLKENGTWGFVPGGISYENGIITSVDVFAESELTASEADTFILPGLVDIHLHGCRGMDFCNSPFSPGDEAIGTICEYETAAGVTSICPTTMTYDEERLTLIVNKIREFAAGDHPLKDAVKGIHLEGPFISREKCGAQNPLYITDPDPGFLRRLQEASGNLIRLVAIAPEQKGAIECIREGMKFTGDMALNFSIAHTTADYDTAKEAIEAGAHHVTHMYNAMPPLLCRSPGVIGAAFDDPGTFVELIGDGIHIHPAVIRATFSMFGADRIVLISDSMEATGMPDGTYALGGQEVYKKGGLATLRDGTIAGSATDLFACMKNVIAMGIPAEDAIRAATINPAISAGISDRAGSLEAGKDADILICDAKLDLQKVIISGKTSGSV